MSLNETMDKFTTKINRMSPIPFTLTVLGFYLTLLTLWGFITYAFITWGIPFINTFHEVKDETSSYDMLIAAFFMTWLYLLAVALYDIVQNTLIGKPIRALMDTDNRFLFYFVRNPLLFISWPFLYVAYYLLLPFTIVFWFMGLFYAGFHWLVIFLVIVILMAKFTGRR